MKAMWRKVLCTVGASGVLMGATLFGVVSPVEAQYPPGGGPVTSSAFVGSCAIGETCVIVLNPTSPWEPGTSVAVTVNGVFVANKIAGADGTVSVTVTVLSATELSIDDPVLVAGRCGRNNARGVGFSRAANAEVTHTAFFDVECPGAAAARPSRGQVALTGANVVRWSAIALGLILVGGLFVALDRRKARSNTSD